jgi:hypothetical protein
MPRRGGGRVLDSSMMEYIDVFQRRSVLDAKERGLAEECPNLVAVLAY